MAEIEITPEIEEQVYEELKKRITPLVFDTHRTIVENTPVDTGRLRSSIAVEETDFGFNIGTNVEYATEVEYDTKPHLIVPKKGKALRFEIGKKMRLAKRMGPKGARFIFCKVVHHPGTTGHHMFLKGINYFRSNLERYLTK